MRRREFIALLAAGAMAWPSAGRAQQPKTPVVGVLACLESEHVAGFCSGLREVGYVENQNVSIEITTTYQYERLPALAAELVRRDVAVIVSLCGPATPLLKAATTTVPIVFGIGGDPVRLNLVSSLNRPEGNVTGVTFFAAHLLAKQVGLLRSMLPNASLFGVFSNPNNPRHQTDAAEIQAAGRALGVKTHDVKAGSVAEFGVAFEALRRAGADAVLICGDAFFVEARKELAVEAAQRRLPALFRQTGVYTGRILRGQTPSELPVLQPTKFDLAINLKVAKDLNLDLPPTLIALADEVIE